jgi:hypothetical protein
VQWDVVRGAGKSLAAPGGIIASARLDGEGGLDLGRNSKSADVVEQTDQAAAAISLNVAMIAGRNPGEAAAALALAGIGFVMLPASEHSEPLAAALDSTAGLARISDADGQVVWRVAPQAVSTVDKAARAHLVSAQGAQALDVGPGRMDSVSIDPDPTDAQRTVVLAERRNPGWRATLNGRALKAVDSSWQQTFAVGTEGGTVRIWYEGGYRWVLWVQGVVAGLALLIALPLRRNPAREEEI